MLVALPAFAQKAPRQLASWEEAVAVWSANSTDARIAAAEVVRAAGRRRVALGASLPQFRGSGLASFSLLPSPAGGDEATAALFGAAPYQTLSLVAQLAIIDLRAWNSLAAAFAGHGGVWRHGALDGLDVVLHAAALRVGRPAHLAWPNSGAPEG